MAGSGVVLGGHVAHLVVFGVPVVAVGAVVGALELNERRRARVTASQSGRLDDDRHVDRVERSPSLWVAAAATRSTSSRSTGPSSQPSARQPARRHLRLRSCRSPGRFDSKPSLKVSTPIQVDALSALGCDLAQGFYFFGPLDAKAMDDLLAATTTDPDSILQARHIQNRSTRQAQPQD
jgi:hypothetical protein